MNIMEIVKKRRFEVACLAAGLILLLALLPVSRKGAAANDLADTVAGQLRRISTLLSSGGKAGPANPDRIEARKKDRDLIAAEANRIIEGYEKINSRAPLVPDLFPDPGTKTFSYRQTYDAAINSLLSETLNAGWPGGQELASSQHLLDEDEAASIGIYARRTDLKIGDWVTGAKLPSEEDCWFGQLSYWIQQDLAEIISEMNQDAADARKQTPSVKNAAVKRIISIHVDPFYFIGEKKQQTGYPGFAPAPSGQPAPPGPMGMPNPMNPYASGAFGPGGMGGPGYVPPSSASSGRERQAEKAKAYKDDPFTERFSGDKADVLHFTFSLVVDSRKINEFLDALAHRNLYTILSVSVSRQDLSVDSKKLERDARAPQFDPVLEARDDLLYGSDPVVRIDVAAEALFLKSVYGEMMPKSVKDALSNKIEAQKKMQERMADAAKAAAKKSRKKKPKRR